MSRAQRTAVAMKRGQFLWDNAAPPEDEDEDDEFDPEEAERDLEAMQSEQLWQKDHQ